MQELFSSRLLRWVTVPYRSRLLNAASRPFYQVADRVLGSQLLSDLADFFILLQTMREGFVARAEAVDRLLHDHRTTFLLVTTLEPIPVRESLQMLAALAERRFHLGLLVCNRVLPRSFRDSLAKEAADALLEEDTSLAAELSGELSGEAKGASSEVVAGVLAEVSTSFSNFRQVATREGELLRELSFAHQVTATVPYRPGEVTDLAGLLAVGEEMWGLRPRRASARRR
jgi:anion-transporting  ArsA/GET3 family ATPase